MRFLSPGPEQTHRLARALGAIGGEGLVMALQGPLGAGKTAFVRGLAEGFGAPIEQVASPTFTIAHEYLACDGRRLVHLDLYRVESVAELEATGYLDWLGPETWLAVEWADRFPEALPKDRLQVTFARPPGEGRERERVLDAEARGPRAQRALAAWEAASSDPIGSAE